MHSWLAGEDLGGGVPAPAPTPSLQSVPDAAVATATKAETVSVETGVSPGSGPEDKQDKSTDGEQDGSSRKTDRVVVVHCKAGKGRSGTMACSYLIAECGWKPEDAMARFTERRMRPKFGAGVSIPSQLRWISYVERWAKGGKRFVDRPMEIVEIHVWGLRHGVKVEVEGYEDEGKRIKVFHTFKKHERIVVEGDAPGGAGVMDFVSDLAGYGLAERENSEIVENADYQEIAEGKVDTEEPKNNSDQDKDKDKESRSSSLSRNGSEKKGSRASSLMRKISTRSSRSRSKSTQSTKMLGKEPSKEKEKSKTIALPEASQAAASAASSSPLAASSEVKASDSTPSLQSAFLFADPEEPGGQAVIFKPEKPVRIPNGDVNISFERRNRAHSTVGLTVVTAVAHVWFNNFFEGNGPEQDGRADDSGVFEIDWDKMDGIKGSSKRGTKACDRLSVVWRVVGTSGDGVTEAGEGTVPGSTTATAAGVTINEPAAGAPVPQMRPADWKSGEEGGAAEKRLGLHVQDDTDSASISKASSVDGNDDDDGMEARDDESLEGVKVSGPLGEDVLDDSPVSAPATSPQSRNDAKADATAKRGFIIE